MKKQKEQEVVKVSNNGHSEANGQIDALIGLVQSLNTRLDDLQGQIEDAKNTSNAAKEATLKLVNFVFDTDDDHAIELSFISPLAARPFAEALTLDALTDKNIRSGKTSLNKRRIINFLRFQRSVRGRLLIGVAKEALSEQISTQNEEDAAEEFKMGEK